jgi:hypothetical protein
MKTTFILLNSFSFVGLLIAAIKLNNFFSISGALTVLIVLSVPIVTLMFVFSAKK